MENKIYITIHIITAILFGITMVSAIEKRKNLKPFVGLLIIVYTSISVISHIRELLIMDMNLTWMFPQWYVTRILSCIIIMFFISRTTGLKAENFKLKQQINPNHHEE